jgi:unsaturated rhamnogalacturonyl hydrolase
MSSASESDLKLAAVFRRTLAMHQPGRAAGGLTPGAHLNSWDWGPGIALYGLQKTYPLVGPALQQQYLDFLPAWFATYLDDQPPTPAINGAILLNVLWSALRDPAIPFEGGQREMYRAYCLARVAYYRRQAIKLPSGVFAHTVASGSPQSKEQVWADNLFMLVLLLARVAVTEGDTALFGQMVEQLQLHYRHLTDPATGLLYHGWQASPLGDPAGSHLNRALWGRGNGWAALGGLELLELAQTGPFSSFREKIRQACWPHLAALRRYQRPDGRWNTLLDQPAAYPETSATAAISAAFLKGVRLGGLPPGFSEAGQRGLAATLANISDTGGVEGVSGSTPLLASLADYNKVPHDEINTWGQGLALLALREELRGRKM